MLQWRHDETIGHEAHSSLKVEWRRQYLGIWDDVAVVQRVPPIELVDLNREEVIFVWAAFLAHCALPYGGQGLGYCVCDAAQHLGLWSAAVQHVSNVGCSVGVFEAIVFALRQV